MTHPATEPVLSVIIPAWNAARYLGDAITSVLGQGVAGIEVIVLVDEGSEDDSARVAEEFVPTGVAGPSVPTVRCIRHPHMGLAAARNEGASLARGRLLLHLDADDVLTPESLAVRLAILNADPDVDIVTGSAASFVSPEIPADEAARYDLPAGPQQGGLPGTSIVRASFAERVGPQDTSLPHSGDLDWMIRAGEAAAKTVVIPDVVLRRRIHGRNTSLLSKGTASRLRILRAALARRARSENPSLP